MALGGDQPVRIQSMCTTATLDTRASVEQCIRIVRAGGEMVRLTVRNIREARNLDSIKKELLNRGYAIPLVADVHFSPDAAMEAAIYADKVRINPGNFATRSAETVFLSLLEKCRRHHAAVRIGVNHGSLSGRIMEEFGNTPAGMVESALEYLRICIREDFRDAVVSMKSSNTRVMVHANRMLARKMSGEGMDFPLHLGVTEAGAGEEGRIRSAVGIGTLLNEGLGDTIRVSLTEAPEYEIPAAKKLLDSVSDRKKGRTRKHLAGPEYYTRRESMGTDLIGGGNPPVIIGLPARDNRVTAKNPDYLFVNDRKSMENLPGNVKVIMNAGQWTGHDCPEAHCFPLFALKDFPGARRVSSGLNFVLVKADETDGAMEEAAPGKRPVCLVYVHSMTRRGRDAFARLRAKAGLKAPVIIMAAYREKDPGKFAIKAAAELGSYFIDGYADGLWLENPNVSGDFLTETGFRILQASRARMTETDYIACPSCGRTTFDIQERLAEIRKHTSHLRHLKIAVMGCIVNGPGEMADADYGYVGAGPGRVSLYKGKTLRKKNIPERDALLEMLSLIKESGDWKDPDVRND